MPQLSETETKQAKVLLVKLTIDQVSSHWSGVLLPAIRASLPPTVYDSNAVDSKLLESALTGKLSCWVAVDDQEIVGVVTTTVTEDECTGVRNLWIYSIYGFTNIHEDVWVECLKTVVLYARSVGCHRVLGYTNAPHVVKWSEKLGARTNSVLVEFDLHRRDGR